MSESRTSKSEGGNYLPLPPVLLFLLLFLIIFQCTAGRCHVVTSPPLSYLRGGGTYTLVYCCSVRTVAKDRVATNDTTYLFKTVI